jgi:hypothetical protein
MKHAMLNASSDAVLRPSLLVVSIHPAKLVDHSFRWSQNWGAEMSGGPEKPWP